MARNGYKSPKVDERKPEVHPYLKKLIKKHGQFVKVPDTDDGWILFEDGAAHEGTVNGRGGHLEPPPDDEWERAQMIAQYHQIKAEEAEEEFEDFYGYLHGDGVCPEGINSDEEKLDYLKKLRAKARTAKAKYREARKEVKENEPAWIGASKRGDAVERRRQEQFMAKVKSIKL